MNAHNVRKWVNSRIRQGRLKNCVNLVVEEVICRDERDGEMRLVKTFFAPRCLQTSFEWIHPSADKRTQYHLLEYQLSLDPIKCPEGCSYYQNVHWARIKARLNRCVVGVGAFFSWLAKAPWQTQCAIIFVIGLTVFGKYLPQIVKLIEAIRK